MVASMIAHKKVSTRKSLRGSAQSSLDEKSLSELCNIYEACSLDL